MTAIPDVAIRLGDRRPAARPAATGSVNRRAVGNLYWLAVAGMVCMLTGCAADQARTRPSSTADLLVAPFLDATVHVNAADGNSERSGFGVVVGEDDAHYYFVTAAPVHTAALNDNTVNGKLAVQFRCVAPAQCNPETSFEATPVAVAPKNAGDIALFRVVKPKFLSIKFEDLPANFTNTHNQPVWFVGRPESGQYWSAPTAGEGGRISIDNDAQSDDNTIKIAMSRVPNGLVGGPVIGRRGLRGIIVEPSTNGTAAMLPLAAIRSFVDAKAPSVWRLKEDVLAPFLDATVRVTVDGNIGSDGFGIVIGEDPINYYFVTPAHLYTTKQKGGATKNSVSVQFRCVPPARCNPDAVFAAERLAVAQEADTDLALLRVRKPQHLSLQFENMNACSYVTDDQPVWFIGRPQSAQYWAESQKNEGGRISAETGGQTGANAIFVTQSRIPNTLSGGPLVGKQGLLGMFVKTAPNGIATGVPSEVIRVFVEAAKPNVWRLTDDCNLSMRPSFGGHLVAACKKIRGPTDPSCEVNPKPTPPNARPAGVQ